jgi:putative chitinase
MITKPILRAICSSCPDDKIDLYLPFINAAMTEFHIDNYARQTAFIAQIAHETGEFKWMREIWGPTAQQKKYEPFSGSKLAEQLGNIEPGDGEKFKGRGAIQLTGRSNYAKFGKILGVDFIIHPQLAESHVFAFRIAGAFWETHGLNELADAGEFGAITRRINGGLNGQPQRLAYWEKAKELMK